MADGGYQDYSQRTNFGQSLSQGAQDAPLAGTGAQIFTDANKGDIGAVSADVGNFALGAKDVISDPLNALISAGLGFLMDVITPLRDELQKVTGDSGALDIGKEKFEEISKDIENLAKDLDGITKSGFQNWSGDAKEAATQKIDTFVKGVEGTASNADDVASLLEASGILMEAAYNIVMGIISDCIEWIIVTWVAAQAAAPFTLGGSEAAAAGATAAEVAGESANAASKVEEATTMVQKIEQIFQKIMATLKKIEGSVKTAAEDGSKKLADNWQDALRSGSGKSFSQYMTEHESGEPMNKLEEAVVNPILEGTIKGNGMAADGKFGPADQSDSQINDELQG
ncbi:MAG TPA: hypothetical protein VG317_09075 [Pseudonocardiaceae bacterium]|jgi:hypothetical protein|nr:hypothetical protein [Pseudonocardiaceae bacterium]